MTPTTEKWFYAGQRISDQKLYYAWLPEGSTRFYLYKKLVGGIVGSAYEVQVTRTDTVAVQRDVKRLDEVHADAVQWAAVDAAERTRFTMQQRDAKLRRESRSLGDMTLAQVAQQYANLVGAQRPAFLAQVLSRIM